ncbi:MAG: hypothetical protein NTZ68_00920 [Candidatus Dependentiae bacterium]|nr:hypothetical protein [Candidatus Dependentiae bacterium]
MKKLLVSILSSSIVMRASEEILAPAPESFSEEFLQEVESVPSRVEMGWRDMVMAHWHNMSPMHQYIVLGVVALVVFYVIRRLMKCGGGCTCGCGKSGSCGCK